MPTLHLSDGRTIELPEGEPVGSALTDGAIAVRALGELHDLSWIPDGDTDVEAIDLASEEGLHVLRHSTAHVLAQAVCRRQPGAKYAVGPPIENGFYYDFELPDPLTPDDLDAIEKEMRAIVAADQPFLREELTRADALERFADQPYKR